MVVAARVIVGDAVAVHGQGIDAHVDAADRLSFSVRLVCGWFPIGDAGIPAPVMFSDRHLVGNSIRQRAGHSDAAQVWQSYTAVSVVLDLIYARGGEERPGAGESLSRATPLTSNGRQRQNRWNQRRRGGRTADPPRKCERTRYRPLCVNHLGFRTPSGDTRPQR